MIHLVSTRSYPLMRASLSERASIADRSGPYSMVSDVALLDASLVSRK